MVLVCEEFPWLEFSNVVFDQNGEARVSEQAVISATEDTFGISVGAIYLLDDEGFYMIVEVDLPEEEGGVVEDTLIFTVRPKACQSGF